MLVSAFYAEHPGKRLQLDGYIWTKSKFLGLSIGVHMVGQACVSVLDYDEEYLVTFPNAYGRCLPMIVISSFIFSFVVDTICMYYFTCTCYFCTRSILTTPWVELGGKCNITCAKTGYSAEIEFLTKVVK